MPCGSIFCFLESYSKKILIDRQNRRHNDRNGEILLDERVIQGEGFLNILAVIISVIPEVKFAIKRKPFFFVLFFLHRKQDLLLL